ncbi:MAG: hypothetical protein Kow00128_18520 [Deltaproteobacteria bacterium]
MQEGKPIRREWIRILLGLLVLPLLYAVHRFNHTLSHDIAEIFSVVVACAIFLFAWNARRFLDNGYYLFIGISFLFVGCVDFIHAMSYEGMFRGDGNNLPGQLWYAARYLQAGSLLAAPFFCDRKVRTEALLSGYLVLSLLLVGSILLWPVFPATYVEGVGVTTFKTASDYLVAAILLASMGALRLHRDRFDPSVLRLLYWAVALSIGSELSFNLYRDYYAYNNLFGHYLKIVSFFLFYRALIATGLFRPYGVLFREMKRSEEALRAASEELEARVEERTAELRAANLRLEKELAGRQRAVEMRQLILDLLQKTQSVQTVREFLPLVTRFVQSRFVCDAVGIRYRRNGDYPYFSTRGFSEEFLEAEGTLCSAEQAMLGAAGPEGPRYECVCGAVIEGRIDPSLPCVTPGGSFVTNDASGLVASSVAVRSISTRGRCVREGYESIVLVPLRLGGETIGLLQANDRRKGQFPPHRVVQLERIAENVAAMLGRLLAQEALAQSEERFRSLVEHSTAGILIVQGERIVFRNRALERILGPVPEGRPFCSLGTTDPEDTAPFEAFCRTTAKEPFSRQEGRFRFRVPGSSAGTERIRWVHCQSAPIEYGGSWGALVSVTDITRTLELEAAVASRERLASLGQLAAGIAHEIRNPLSGINLNLSTVEHLCRESEALPEEERERIAGVLGQAKAASARIATVVRSIMEFAKPGPPALAPVDLNEVAGRAVGLCAASVRKRGIEIASLPEPDLPKRFGDARLLEQVLVNLITNAAQALETVDGPRRIEVSTAVEEGSAVLRVSDSGPGVPAPMREKIFDPFYTTRKEGHGIGLSFSHRVVSEHGGRLEVGESRLGGAEFRITLPENGRDGKG